MNGDCREFLPGVGPTSKMAWICCVKIGTCTGITVSASARYYEGGCRPHFGGGIIQTPANTYYANNGRANWNVRANSSTSTTFPTSTEGCVKQGECALPYLEHIKHWTAVGGVWRWRHQAMRQSTGCCTARSRLTPTLAVLPICTHVRPLPPPTMPRPRSPSWCVSPTPLAPLISGPRPDPAPAV